MTKPMDASVAAVLRSHQDSTILLHAFSLSPEFAHLIDHPGLHFLFDSYDDAAARRALAERIDLPMVFLEYARKFNHVSAVFIDPPRIGSALTLSDWLVYWEVMIGEQLIESSFEDIGVTGDRILHLLHPAVAVASAAGYTGLDLQDLVDRLWGLRLVAGVQNCAWLRIAALVSGEKEFNELVAEGSEARRAFQELDHRIRRAKEESASLDEWFELIYCLSLLACYANILLRQATYAGAKQMARFAEEVYADIGTVFNSVSRGVFERRPRAVSMGLMRNTFGVIDGSDPIDPSRKLSYRYRARVTIPRCWYEVAAASLSMPIESLPPILDEFNEQHMASIAISFEPDYAADFILALVEWPNTST